MSVSLIWVKYRQKRSINRQRESQTKMGGVEEKKAAPRTHVSQILASNQCVNIPSTRQNRKRKQAKRNKKWPAGKRDPLFIITLSMFSAVPPAGAVHSVTNWVWLFSIQSAMCNEKHCDKSKREVNQTDSVGELGGRKTDRDRRRMTKSPNY